MCVLPGGMLRMVAGGGAGLATELGGVDMNDISPERIALQVRGRGHLACHVIFLMTCHQDEWSISVFYVSA